MRSLEVESPLQIFSNTFLTISYRLYFGSKLVSSEGKRQGKKLKSIGIMQIITVYSR